MISAIIVISLVVLVIVFVLLFRVQTLTSVLKGSAKKRGGTLNKVNALLCLLFLIVGGAAFFYYTFSMMDDYTLPEAASVHGKVTDNLFWVSMGIVTAAFFLTQILLFGFAYKYQYKEGRKAKFYPDNHILEFAWTVIPAIVLTFLVWQGWKTWTDITTIPSRSEDLDRIELEIMGQQFLWQVRYPGLDGEFGRHYFKLIDETNQFGMDFNDQTSYDDFVPREIHLPIGKPVLFKIRAKDVLHSVYAPHFRLKMDAVPGMPTKFYFTPDKTTQQMRSEIGKDDFNYEIACAEMCGRGHFGMRYIIVVEEEEEFLKWYKDQNPWSEINADYVKASLSGDELASFNNWIDGISPAVEGIVVR